MIALGLLIIAIGAFCQSSSYVPINKIKDWSWESYWIVQGVFAWLVLPLLGALLAVPEGHSLCELFSSNLSASGMTFFYGVLWGIGGLTFGLSMRYLGVALGQSLALGTCAALGTLLAPIFTGHAADLTSSVIIGVIVTLIGIAIIGVAGAMREENQKKVKTYDFKRPDKFSKDQIRTLNMLHDNFARLFNTYLSTYLRALVSVEVVSVEQLTYQEFVQSLSNPSVIGILAVPPLKGNIILEMNSGIAFSIIDRVFGGQGDNTIKPRVLTEIEEAVIRRIFDKALGHLREAWFNVVQFNPKMEAMESNPQFAQIVPPSDMVVIITLKTQIGSVEGFLNICIPYLVVEPIMSKLTTTFWVSANVSKEDHPENTDIIKEKLRRTKVPVIVQMGQFDISVREFLSLSYGYVLQLDTRVDDELKCIIGSDTKFLCRPGTSGKRSAVQITKLIKTEGDEGTNG